MVAEFGYGILVIAFLVALYSVGAAVYGYQNKSAAAVESARRAMLLLWPLITIASASLIYLLVSGHFEVSFVYEVTDRSMPTYLKVTAWWGGQAGSLVFWSWLMSAFASLVTLRKWDRDHEFLPWVIVVTSITTAFFLGLVIFAENPFARFWLAPSGDLVTSMLAPTNAAPYVPADGRGLNALLRHPGMIIHPPMLYLGFVSFVIPFAFAIAALVTGRSDDRWIRLTRRWALWAWMFLSLGLVLGSRWAYDVLGWGGFWGWDAVEVAAFIPWLTGTAFLHSVMIQEKRGMFKHWNMLLIILTYCLVIFGTFLTRSGVLSSVHAFAQSAIGPAFFAFIGLSLITSVVLLIHRWPELRGETELQSMLSRESFFLFNNLLFILSMFVCFLGIIFPLVSELVTGQKVTVGPPWYTSIIGPLFSGLILLMALAPLSTWGTASLSTLGRQVWKPAALALVVTIVLFFTYTRVALALVGFFLLAMVLFITFQEFWRAARARMHAQSESFATALWKLFGRNPRRYGGYIVHISMMLMAIGILGISFFQIETQGTVPVNESLSLAGYRLKYDSIAQFWAPDNRQVTRAVVSVYDQNGDLVDQLHPRIDVYPAPDTNGDGVPDGEGAQPMTIPGLHSTLKDDVYVLLINWEPASAVGATFKIYVNPLVNWLWIGALVFIVGILVAAWPRAEAMPAYAPERRIRRADGHQPSAAD